MKTISTAYYEKMAEAKQTFCAFCMRGAMPFLEDCKDCKINRMFKAVQAVIKEETTPQDEAAVEKTRNAYDGIDLPKEMIESLGRGPRNHDGFRTSPAFQLFITNGAYPDVEVQLIESKTGFPDFSGSEEETSSRSTVHYLNYLEKGVGVPSSIQLWDLTYDTLKDELKSLLERMFNRSIHQFWGIQALPFPERYFITSRSAEELAADMMSEVGGYQASDVDEYGCVYSQEHYVGCLRNSNISTRCLILHIIKDIFFFIFISILIARAMCIRCIVAFPSLCLIFILITVIQRKEKHPCSCFQLFIKAGIQT